ncbi:TRAP transporter small permease [Virgibacillus sp. NKC19-3]|uniref:TRAP transporter small permease n=1 Tax=Virgibacillus saliphilus TaxID=2831674 RepID=UPI001C9AC05E|nr:TRAP transporter small permease [Virgibacillus sp. NKC19-3]MBY7142303.1 TRAP transporter small permease [Virgibacillus sp. NKC19-3]
MSVLKNVKKGLDKILLFTALIMLASMTIVIIYQVFSRQFLNHTPAWSEGASRVLFVWVAFLGMAYGFKEKLHIGVSIFVNMLPEKIQTICDIFAKLLIIGFGVLMIYYGWNFTILMNNSTLAGLGLPSSVLYASIPITGIFIVLNGIELLFVKGLHQNYEEGEGE